MDPHYRHLIAVESIEKRLTHSCGSEIAASYDISGISADAAGAEALSLPLFDFERWAVSEIGGQPNEKQIGDRGIDCAARFPIDHQNNFGRVLMTSRAGKA